MEYHQRQKNQAQWIGDEQTVDPPVVAGAHSSHVLDDVPDGEENGAEEQGVDHQRLETAPDSGICHVGATCHITSPVNVAPISPFSSGDG